MARMLMPADEQVVGGEKEQPGVSRSRRKAAAGQEVDKAGVTPIRIPLHVDRQIDQL